MKIQYISGSKLPYLLNEIPDKPKGLYIYGNAELLQRSDLRFLCVIGSRKYSAYGEDACRELISALAGKPVAIVSGLALGIDGIAHRTALEYGIPCIAVPGSGLNPDILYPRSHTYLAEDIVENGGVLLSEYEPNFRATPWTFPMRNRIMAGLSHAVLIIEGENDSGTLITARLALDYNRDVLALPGSIFSTTSEGPLSLIKRGAVPICSGKDLLLALGFNDDSGDPLSEIKDTESTYKNNTLRDAPEKSEVYRNCSEEEMLVIALLKEPLVRDDLFNKINEQRTDSEKISFSKLQVILSMLEIRGLINEEYGFIKLIKTINLSK